jgi:hypothetical protein
MCEALAGTRDRNSLFIDHHSVRVFIFLKSITGVTDFYLKRSDNSKLPSRPRDPFGRPNVEFEVADDTLFYRLGVNFHCFWSPIGSTGLVLQHGATFSVTIPGLPTTL